MFSRDIRSETLYFVFTDRFHDGDPDNNIGINPELSDASRRDWQKYWGGDLQGVIEKLDYLVALGVTAIWISPVFDQVDEVSDALASAPYHGYWTKDFKRLDEHLVAVEDRGKPFSARDTVFDRLIEEAHARDVRIFLDITCNHTHAGGGDTPKGALYDDGIWLTSFEDDQLGWYNKHGPIRDWQSAHELQKGELKGGLADLNEDVWGFRHYIMQAMSGWLARGVDGFRIDAVKHMSLSFWQEFVATMRKQKEDVVLFGEWAGIGWWDSMGVHFTNHSEMSVLDFSFQYAAQAVLCDGQPWRRLAEVFHQDSVYDDATELITFLDNHDMPRLLSAGLPVEHLPLAVTLLLTARGVPCIFYGMEQALHCDEEGGGDPYNRPMMEKWDLDTRVAQILPRLTALRRRNLAVQRGFTSDVRVDAEVYAFARMHGESVTLTILNRGGATRLDLQDVHLPDGDYHDVLLGREAPIRVAGGRVEGLRLEPGACIALEHSVPLPESRSRVVVRLNGYEAKLGERVVVMGDAAELGQWDPKRAAALHYVNANLWTGDLLFEQSAGRQVLYRFAVLSREGQVRYEDCVPREAHAPESGVSRWRAKWAGG